MGVLNLFSKCSAEPARRSSTELPNPDPAKFIIQKTKQVDDFLIALIKYPNCTNFEGKKILVFYGVTRRQLGKLKRLDPHFCEHGHISPIARFEPTSRGWKYAIEFCKAAS